MKSKTIILSSENEKGRGILTIFVEQGLLNCRIRLYNTPNLNRFCKIGIYHNKQVYSANLLERNGVYTSSMVGEFNIDQDFYSAIIDTNNNNAVILSGGTYAGFFFNDNSVFDEDFTAQENNFSPAHFNNNFEIEQPSKKLFERIEKENPITNLFDYDDESILNENKTNDIKKTQPKNFDCDKCKTCKYKEFFYSTSSQNCEENLSQSVDLNSSTAPHCTENNKNTQRDILSQVETSHNKKIEQNSNLDNICVNSNHIFEEEAPNDVKSNSSEPFKQISNNENTSILQALIPQFKYVFENYPQDEILNGLLPNGKFVKISENNEEYSIGAIYQEDEMKYICYAIMCNYNSPVPTELGPHYQWLPIDKEDPLSEGYYIVFQDANDLKIVEL